MLGLRQQLIVALVAPAIVVLAAMAYFADSAVRGALDVSLGERLVAIAQSAATVVEPRISLVDPGDDDLRIVRSTRKKLDSLIEATSVERVLIIRVDQGTVLVDSAGRLKAGDAYVRAEFDRAEISGVASGASVASVLFRGEEGRWYKTGYAPLRPRDDGTVPAAVVVNAPAEFFDVIDNARNTLGGIALLGLVALLALALFTAREVTIPLSRLSDAAERIGAGALATEIPDGGPKEAVVLSETMRGMARSLAERDDEMQMMLGGIAHEVRNPLGGIELFGSLLREDLEADDPRRKHVDKILKEIGVLANVVNDFLAFARRQPLQPSAIRVRDLVVEVVAMSQKEAADTNVAIEADVDRELAANLDAQSMHGVLLNLVRNAVQATPAGGHVHVRAQVVESTLRLEVEDTGPGIPQESRKDVFTAFFTTKQKGTGLGLALVKKAVDAHGGTIAVDQGAEGGALFVIDLPHDPDLRPPEEPGLLG